MSLCEICCKNEIFFSRLGICKKCYDLDEHARKEISRKNRLEDLRNNRKQTQNSSKRNSQSIFKKAYQKWSTLENEELEKAWISKKPYEQICKMFDRSENAIRAQIKKSMLLNEKMKEREFPASTYQIDIIEKLDGVVTDSIYQSSRIASDYIDKLIIKNGKKQKISKSQEYTLLRLGYSENIETLNMFDAQMTIKLLLQRELGEKYDSSKRILDNFNTFRRIFPVQTSRSKSRAEAAADRDDLYDAEQEQNEEEGTCPNLCNFGCELCGKCPECSGKGCELCDQTGKFDEFESSLLHGPYPEPDDDMLGFSEDD